MVHKPKHKVHSFRGLLADGGEDKINLERSNLNLAYRIVKFAIMPSASSVAEHWVKIYKEAQSSVTAVIDFTDIDLLAAGIVTNDTSAHAYPPTQIVIFDQDLFSRDIYVTHKDNKTGEACNYYIELEEVPVGAATLMQLKLAVARKLSLSESAPDA